jgi:hypothetical protein
MLNGSKLGGLDAIYRNGVELIDLRSFAAGWEFHLKLEGQQARRVSFLGVNPGMLVF